MFKFRSREQGIDRGREIINNEIKVISRFRRHADPEKKPDGMSADALSEAGIEQAEVIGCNSKKEYRAEKIKKSFHGPKQRTWETLRYMLHGAGAEDVKSYEKDELDTLPWGEGNLERLKVDENGKKRTIEELIQAVMYDEKMEENRKTVAEKIAWRVKVAENMPKYLEGGDDVEVESVTHGPNQEIFLSEVLKTTDEHGGEQTGFSDLNEMGGMFQPGEGIEVESRIDNTGKEKNKIFMYRMEDDGTTVKSREELDVDWDKIDELAENYRKKKVAQTKEKNRN